MSPLRAGIIGAVVIIVLSAVGFTRFNPFQSQFELDGVFKTGNNLQPDSPVRVAGVNVGKVSSVESLPNGFVKVKLELEQTALPIHKDAQLKIRPRIFLEGNYFVDVFSGTPDSPKVKSGYTVPYQQTAAPVQLDQVLSSLQSDTRQSLQTLFKEYAERGLGNGGAQAYNKGLDYTPGAERYSSIANDATLGQQPHDLSNVLRGQQRLFHSLSFNPPVLEDLVTQLNVTFNAFASEDVALQQTVPALDSTLRVGVPALRALDNALPSLRAFARAALPGTISSVPTIDASLPTITQLHLLLCQDSPTATKCPANDTRKPHGLRALVADLRPTIPALAKLNADTIPFLSESRALSACQNNVLVPFSNTPIPNPDFPSLNNRTPRVVFPQGLSGLAGESRVSDANTPMFHLQIQTGPTTVFLKSHGRTVLSPAAAAPKGARPTVPEKPPNYRPGIPCELQQVPDLNAPGGPPDKSITETGGLGGLLPPLPQNRLLTQRAMVQAAEVRDYLNRSRAGKPAVDPLAMPQAQYVREMRRIGFGVTQQGKVYVLPRGGGR